MIPLVELKRNPAFYFNAFGRDGLLFVRPDSGEKVFKGTLLDVQEVDRFYERYDWARNEIIVVSSPKNISGEWRFVVSHHGDIIALSSYRYQGQKNLSPTAPTGAITLCENVLRLGYFPDSVFCIDVAEDADGDFWVMELTSFSSAGLYACDKNAIVRRVSEIALE